MLPRARRGTLRAEQVFMTASLKECARVQIAYDAQAINFVLRALIRNVRLSRDAREVLVGVLAIAERIGRNVEAFREVPLCVESMGCLCAGHAAGASAATPCDARFGAGRWRRPGESAPSQTLVQGGGLR